MMAVPHSIVLDAEALTALADGRADVMPWAVAARRSDSVLLVSAATLAEVTDGSVRDARVRRAITAVRIVPVTADVAFRAGALRTVAGSRRKPRDLTMDAIVAATAVTVPGRVIVVTRDPTDLSALLEGTEVRVEPLARRRGR